MNRFRPYPVAVFAGATLLIWGNRVWLAWTDPKPDLGDKLVSSVPITAFVIAAAAVLVAQARGRQSSARFATLVATFAGGTVVYWAVRLPAILVHEQPVPFKVVHTALAAVSAALAARAWRARSSSTGGRAEPRPCRRLPAAAGR